MRHHLYCRAGTRTLAASSHVMDTVHTLSLSSDYLSRLIVKTRAVQAHEEEVDPETRGPNVGRSRRLRARGVSVNC